MGTGTHQYDTYEPEFKKIDYILRKGTRCPHCGSDELDGGEVDWDEPLTQQVVCLKCNKAWRDVLYIGDILTDEGEPTNPSLLPLPEFLGYRWIGFCWKGTEMVTAGPFQVKSLRKEAWAMREKYDWREETDSPIWQISIDMTAGGLCFTELDYGQNNGDE